MMLILKMMVVGVCLCVIVGSVAFYTKRKD